MARLNSYYYGYSHRNSEVGILVAIQSIRVLMDTAFSVIFIFVKGE